MKKFRIAVIPGDGIGKEVMPEGLRVLEAVGRKFDIEWKFDEFDWSCDYFEKHGTMMPEDALERLNKHDGVFFGAAGWPDKVPDHISLWGLLIPFRRGYDQYVNLRPVRLMPGMKCPLADRKPGDIDFWVVRENSEGEYSSIGGRMYAGTEREFVTQQAVFSRQGVDRILKYAYELAMKRPKKHLTSATKSNGISISMPSAWRISSRATVPTATRAAVSRALARSRIGRASVWPYFCIPARSAWPGRGRVSGALRDWLASSAGSTGSAAITVRHFGHSELPTRTATGLPRVTPCRIPPMISISSCSNAIRAPRP